MSWFRCDPSWFWGPDAVEVMDMEAAGLLWWLICRSWTQGGIKDDPAYHKKLLRGRCRNFDRLWQEVRAVLEVVDGELRCPWLEEERGRTTGKLTNDAERKRLERRGQKADVQRTSEGHPSDVQLSSAPRGEEREEKRETGGKADVPPPPPAASAKKPRRDPTGPHADCARFWEAEWARTRSGTKCVVKPKDYAAIADMLLVEPPDNVQRRMTAILTDNEPFIRKNASLTFLWSKWDTYAVAAAKPSKPPPEPADAADVRNRWERRHRRKMPHPMIEGATVEVCDPYPGDSVARAELAEREAG